MPPCFTPLDKQKDVEKVFPHLICINTVLCLNNVLYTIAIRFSDGIRITTLNYSHKKYIHTSKNLLHSPLIDHKTMNDKEETKIIHTTSICIHILWGKI